MSEADTLTDATYYVRRVDMLREREDPWGRRDRTRELLLKDVKVRLQLADDGETLRIIVEDRYE
jgi:hypothetical protein